MGICYANLFVSCFTAGLQVDDDWWAPDASNYVRLANGPGPSNDKEWIEASYMHKHGSDYYLFVNWYDCCMGVDSTYEIHVGKSSAGPSGPFKDKQGQLMLNGEGSLLLKGEGKYIGPGHASVFQAQGTDWFSFHYYDEDKDGLPWIETRELMWEQENGGVWPKVTGNTFNPNN